MRRAIAILLGILAVVSACSGPPARTSATRPLAASAPASAPASTTASTAAPTTAPTTAPTLVPGATAGEGPGRPDHVVVVIFENRAYGQIKGNPQAPYLNALMSRAVTFPDAHGVTHPSQPNYLALFSGSTQGVTDDRCLSPFHGRPNLGSQLIAAGYTFTGYSEDLPAAGFRGCSHGGYAAKHNPWVDFDNVPAAANQPYTAWPTDPSRLPTVSFVVPNLCDDMHDCRTSAGDAWAKAHLDPYLRWADTHNSQLIVTFDENDGSPGNQILALIAGAGVTPAVRTGSINHYTVLRTIEAWYGLAPIGNAAGATPINLG
jgi:acid phosphatase